MKKSLIALAVIGAFAGTAAAQTNVTLYGIGDAGIGMYDNDAPGSDSGSAVFSGVQSTSRFGIRGTEDLGSGLKATFNLEAEVDFGTGATGADDQAPSASAGSPSDNFFQRRAVVGLAGGFGEVRLGRDYTPAFTAAGTTDVMGYGLFNNWLTFTAESGGIPGLNGIDTRASNGVHYTSPNWGGLTLRAMYANNEADDTLANPRTDLWGLSGVYANGPLTVSGYYQSLERDPTAVTAVIDEVKQWGLGAQYAFGAFRVAGNYGLADGDVIGGGSIEHEAFGLGLGMKVGVGEVLVNYIHQELDLAGDPEGNSWGLAYVHPLSKRTNLYASYGQVDNKSGGAFGLRYSQSAVAAGAIDADPKAFAVGIRHMF